MGGLMYEKTLCTDYLTSIGRRYDVHSLHGHSTALPTLRYVYVHVTMVT